MTKVKAYKLNYIPETFLPNVQLFVKLPSENFVRGFITTDTGIPIPFKDESGGSSITNTSQLINDGEDEVNPFITLNDIPSFNPNNYDLEDFQNTGADPYAHLSDIVSGSGINSIVAGTNISVDNTDPLNPIVNADSQIEDAINNGEITKAPTENAVYDALQGKFNTPTGNSTQYLDGAGVPTTFPTLLSADKMITIGRNSTGSTLTKGTIVYISGSTGHLPNFIKAKADSETTSSGTFGVVYADIPNNADGSVLTTGTIDTLDTRTIATNPFTSVTLADGDKVYLDPNTAGYITNVKPSAPNHLVYVGYVTRTSPTQGAIVYKIQNGYEIDELHDVAIGSKTDNDIITWEQATNLWKNKSIPTALGYTPENQANKETSALDTSTIKYPNNAVVKSAVDLKVTANSPITGATKTKITYDSKGLVTAGADATTADITDSIDKRYVTDAQLTVIGNTSGTNTGDNATNTQYSGLATSKEDTANKSTSTGDIASSVKFPVWSAVVSYVSSTYQAILTSTNFGTFMNGLTAKNTLVDADEVVSDDSADSNKAKKTSWLNVWLNYLKPKADALYAPISSVSTMVKLSADVTSTITTETVVSDFTFAVSANTTYIIRGRLAIGCNGAGGVNLGSKFPAAATINGNAIGRSSSSIAFTSAGFSTSGTLSGALNSVNSQGGFAFVEIVLNVGANAGNFQLIFASVTAGQTSTIIASGSYLEYIKL